MRSTRALAHVAEAARPTLRPLPDAQADELRALLARRRQLVAMRTAEQHRLENAPPRWQTDIQAHITWLNTRLAALDDDLDTTLRTSVVWREREDLPIGDAAHANLLSSAVSYLLRTCSVVSASNWAVKSSPSTRPRTAPRSRRSRALSAASMRKGCRVTSHASRMSIGPQATLAPRPVPSHLPEGVWPRDARKLRHLHRC